MKTNIDGVEIEGIQVDNSVIERLKDYQDVKDDGVERDLRHISDAVLFLGLYHCEVGDNDQNELHRVIWGLSNVARSIKSFSPYYNNLK